MRLNTEIPEIPIRRHTHWFVSIRVCRNIGVTGGIVVTYIELSVRFRIMIDFGCSLRIMAAPQCGQRKDLLRWARVFLFFKMVISFFAFY